jgi:glycosyltransferase involved in cell wall biosynthesis
MLSSLVKMQSIDIIHTHHRYCELLANSIRGSRSKTVFTALSIVDRRYFVDYRSDKILAVSRAVRNMLTERFGVKRSKILLIPNFVDSEDAKSSASPKAGHNEGQYTLFSAGRFHHEKDRTTLLEAMHLLRGRDVKLVLVGNGEEEAHLRTLAKQNRLNVEIHNEQKALNNFFDASDACILTSVRDPLPSFMLQAGLFRKPFAGTAVDGIPEVIEHGVNGILFPKRSPEDVASSVICLMSDKEASARMADNLHSKVMSEFTEASVVPKIIDVYESLLN